MVRMTIVDNGVATGFSAASEANMFYSSITSHVCWVTTEPQALLINHSQ